MELRIEQIAFDEFQWYLTVNGREVARATTTSKTFRGAVSAFYTVADGMCAELIHYGGENVWIFSDYEDHRMTRVEFVSYVTQLSKSVAA